MPTIAYDTTFTRIGKWGFLRIQGTGAFAAIPSATTSFPNKLKNMDLHAAGGNCQISPNSAGTYYRTIEDGSSVTLVDASMSGRQLYLNAAAGVYLELIFEFTESV